MRFQCFVAVVEEVEAEEEGARAPFVGGFAVVEGGEAALGGAGCRVPIDVVGCIETSCRKNCLDE